MGILQQNDETKGKKQDGVWVTEIYRQQNHASTEWLQYKHCNDDAEAIFVTVGYSPSNNADTNPILRGGAAVNVAETGQKHNR